MLKKIKAVFKAIRIYAIEIPLFFLILHTAKVLLEDQRLPMEEIWLHLTGSGIVLFGLFYGVFAGMIAGLMAAWFHFPSGVLNEYYGLKLTEILFTPFVYMLTGFLIGLVSNTRREKIVQLDENMETLKKSFDEVEVDRERLIQINLDLEKKILSREDSVLELYESAQNLSSLSVREIHDSIPELVNSHLKAASSSFYLYEMQKLMLVSQEGWSRPDQHPEFFERNHPLFLIVHKRKTMLSPRQLKDMDDSMLVLPLVNRDDRLYGIIRIEKMPFLELNDAAVKLLQMLGDWIVQALDNARRFGSSKNEQIHDELTGAHSFTYFKQRLKQELLLARRYQLNLSVALVGVLDYRRIPPQNVEKTLRTIYNVLEFGFRLNDIIARVDYGDYVFGVIFPFTAANGSQIPIERAVEQIVNFEFKPFDDDNELLLLTWDIVDFKEGTLEEHPAILQIMEEAKLNRQGDIQATNQN